jgi:ABC-type dipeptide/oligopeptide/nickel transport system permease subunit
MWRRRHTGNALRDLLTALAALFLLALFHGFVTLLSVEYLGFGPPPPAPSLGMLLAESQQHLLATPGAIVALVVVVGLLAFALYTAAVAIADSVDTRRPLVRLNE